MEINAPLKLSEMSKAELLLNTDRTAFTFDNEIRSLVVHEHYVTRPRLSMLTNNVYIPKLKAKAFANYIYGGETNENYNNYREYENKNTLFNDKNRPRNEYILGIESTYDNACASLVNSYGEVLY